MTAVVVVVAAVVVMAPKKEKKRHESGSKSSKSKKRSSEGGASPEPAKKVKDKNAPKAGKNAYLFFLDSIRHQVKIDNPSVSFGELTKIAGAKWKELSAEDRVPFEEQAAKDSARYKAEKADYVPPVGAGGPTKRAKKDENAPKNALSSYMYFTMDSRAAITREHPEWPVTEISKEMGLRWKALSAEAKVVYEDMARADKKRYEAQMLEFKAEGSFTAAAKLQRSDFGGAAPMDVADSESVQVKDEEHTQVVE